MSRTRILRWLAAFAFGCSMAVAAAPHRAATPLTESERAARGAIPAVAEPLDPRLVTYSYDGNYSYPILANKGVLTHLEFGPDERIVGYYFADMKKWSVKVSTMTYRDVFVLPKLDDIENTATIITNKRQYELVFTTVAPSAAYKRVKWDYNDDAASGPFETLTSTGASPAPVETTTSSGATHAPARRSGASPAAACPGPTVDIAKLNFDYRIEGDAPFKPTMVFDDGHFTWIKMPKHQDLPAPFVLHKDGTAEILNVIPPSGQCDFFLIKQTLPYGALLKLRDETVKIYNRRGEACGLFGCHADATNISGGP